ncbi:unnamed protein product [Closterium sp. NIES-64]|nr:unnamed protein product [Closterium sp. NIES-64]CAI6000563.1 unnamed protein product [Closterium sp. NIES-64]
MECEQQGAAVAATGKGTAEMGAAARGAAASATTGGNMGGAAPCTHLLHPPAALPPPLVPPPAAPAFSPRDPPQLYVPSTLAPFPSASSRRLLSSHTLLRCCLTSRHVNGGMGGITGEVKSFDFFLWSDKQQWAEQHFGSSIGA